MTDQDFGTNTGGVPWRLSLAQKGQLVHALNDVAVMQDKDKRQLVLAEMRSEFGEDFDPARHAAGNTDAYSTLTECLALGVVHQLVDVLKMVGGATLKWRHFSTLVSSMAPSVGLTQADLDHIEKLLSRAPRSALIQALGHPAVEADLPFGKDDVADPVEVLTRLDAVTEPFSRQLILKYLEVMAHQLDDQFVLVELHTHIADLSRRFNLAGSVRDLCKTLSAPREEPDEESVDSGGSEGTEDALIADEPDPIGDEVITETITKTTETPAVDPPLARPSVFGGVPPYNSHFTGRTAVLDDIRRVLKDQVRATLVPQALHGLGGVGKTQLAVKFAHEFQSDYELVWWVQADDERSVRRSLVSLTRRLKLAEGVDVDDTVDNVLEALRRGEPYGRWLLVFDNAGEPQDVLRYLPKGPGHLLITSRSRTWTSAANAIEVDVFHPDESVQLLRARWPELTHEQALQLADRLGHLPLALEQAVALHEQTGTPLSEYLESLDSDPTVILEEGAPVDYPYAVATMLRLAFESLEGVSLAASQLLRLCAFVSSQPINIPMLTRGRGAPLPKPLDSVIRNTVTLRAAVRDIGRFSLAQLDSGRDFVKIHSLVRAVLRDSLSTDERTETERNAHALLGLANPGTPDDPDTWPLHAQLAPHVIPSGVIYSADQDARQVVLDQVRYLYAIGDYAASRELGELAVETWRSRLGPEDEMTLIACRHLANSLRALGNYANARKLNEDTLDRLRATLGENHEHTMATANSVAADLRLIGKFDRARELDEANLERYQQLLGEDDPSTLRSANNLAVDYRLLGNFRRARELDEDLVERRAKAYGADDPRTLFSYTQLVRDLYGLGMYQDALALQLEKLRKYEQQPPRNEDDVLLAKRNLAMLLRKTGNYQRALRQAEEVHEAYRKFGRTHELALAALLTLCNSLRALGDLNTAQVAGQEALASYREAFGRDHPFTLAATTDLALVMQALGKYDEAAALNARALAGFRETLGDEHPHTLAAACNHSNDLAFAGRYEEARALSEDTYHKSLRVRVKDHPATLACAANLALDLDATGEQAEAAALRKDTLARMRARLGPEHPETNKMGRDERADCDIELTAA